jgi:hypothetical protein
MRRNQIAEDLAPGCSARRVSADEGDCSEQSRRWHLSALPIMPRTVSEAPRPHEEIGWSATQRRGRGGFDTVLGIIGSHAILAELRRPRLFFERLETITGHKGRNPSKVF